MSMTRQMADDEVLRVLGLAILAARRGAQVPADDIAEARAAVAALQAERDEWSARALREQTAHHEATAALEALRGQVAGLVETWQWRSQGLSYVMDAEEANEKCADELAALLAIKERMGDGNR